MNRAEFTAVREELHEVADKIDAYLTENHAPPIWWHVSDIAHRAAGCVWDDERGPDGAYDCEVVHAEESRLAARVAATPDGDEAK